MGSAVGALAHMTYLFTHSNVSMLDAALCASSGNDDQQILGNFFDAHSKMINGMDSPCSTLSFGPTTPPCELPSDLVAHATSV